MRPNKNEYYLNIAAEVAKRSTCLRRHYILKNSYLWKNNVPDDIYEELEVLK